MTQRIRSGCRIAVGVLGMASWTLAAGDDSPRLQLDPRTHDATVPVTTYKLAEQPAAAPEADAADLQKKTLNPVADLISIPFQYNADFDIGPKNATKSTLNIQPVIPISISEDWNVVIRTIVPIIYIDSIADGISSKSGLGDTVPSFFFVPRKEVGGWILGAGPVFLWPTATDDALGSEKWGVGPTGVALRQKGPWTYGILANHIWSYAGESGRSEVNATFLQPFLSYSFPTFTSITLNTESTYDWTDDQWTVPINLAVSQILKLGKLPVSVQVGARYYAEAPDGGPDWGARFVFTILLPKSK
jgi:hypothetical protein